jgi:3-dehydroquinate synthase
LGWLSADALLRTERLFLRSGLPVHGPRLGAARYLALMRHDKKVQDGRLRLILLRNIGEAVVSDQADEAAIGAAIESRCT